MRDAMLPLIRQLHDADGNVVRARLLLAMPDAVILKYASAISRSCVRAGFSGGGEYIMRRVVAMRAVRTPQGLLPQHIAHDFEMFRAAFAAFANGGDA